MMTPTQYEQWRRLHADLFNLHSPDDLRLFTLWERCLEEFDFEELRDASYALASGTDDKRRWRENHLSMLREVVIAKRATTAARERDRLDQMYAGADCQDCFGVGLVRVPHRDWIVDGSLERPFFMAVACLCPVGAGRINAVNKRLAEADSPHRLMDLAKYEAMVPDWRIIVAAHRERQASELEGAELARRVDRIAPIDPTTIKKVIHRGKS